MGTSNSFGGAGGSKPLIPSWVDAGGGGTPPAAPPTAPPPGGPLPATAPTPPANPANPAQPAIAPTPTTPATGGPSRFTAPRTQFSRFASSGGSDRRSLGRSVAGYVRGSMGGASTAARRMGASRRAGGSLAGFLNNAQANGVREALRAINLEGLAGRPIQEVFLGLVDFVCPDGGSLDDAIARDAFIETVADLSSAGIDAVDTLTPAQVQTVLELYATHAIEARICNDIGSKLMQMPADPAAALRVQDQLRDFIRRAVSDAITRTGTAPNSLTRDETTRFMTDIYQAAFEVLQTLGDREG